MTCSICNNTGLVPFRRADGSVVPNAFLDCACESVVPEHYHRVRPDDFDFAMSDSFRGYSFEQCGLPDPASIQQVSPPAEEPKEQVIIHRHSNMSKEEYNLLQQTSLKADYLEKRFNELQSKRKPKGKY